MRKFSKIISLALVISLLLTFLPQKIFLNTFENIKSAEAEGLLTREDAKKFEGIVDGGYEHTVIKQEDGTVIGTGESGNGQTNVSEWKDIIAVSAGDYFTIGLKSDGTVVTEGYTNSSRTVLDDWKEIIDISSAENRTVGLKRDGTVIAVGDDSNGKIDVSGWKDIIGVSTSNYHTVGLKRDGTVVAVGTYPDAFKGVGNWTDIVAISAGDSQTVGLKRDGTVVATGKNNFGETNVSGWTDIVAISAGGIHTVGLRSDGTVVAVGDNRFEQTNVSSWRNIIAISANGYHTFGLKSDGTVVSVGDNYGGQKNVNEWKDITAVSAGEKHTVGLKRDGTVEAEGLGFYTGSVSGWTDIIGISAGDRHTAGLKSDGTVVVVGNDVNGEADVTDWKDIIGVSAGGYFTVGLKNDGTVVATGSNNMGQTNVIGWEDIIAISAGNGHTVGLKRDGAVVAAGNNDNGQANVRDWTDIVAISAGGAHTVGLKRDGTVVAVGGNHFGQTNVDGWKDIVAISAGVRHTVGIKSDGTVVAVGDNNFGQTNTSGWNDIIDVTAGFDSTIGLKSDGTVVATNWQGQADGSVLVDKKVLKPSDTVNITLKNSNFYKILNEQFKLSGSANYEGQMDITNENERKLSYHVQQNDIGHVNIVFPGVLDYFGNYLAKEDIFQVIPLQSITSSKNEVKSGDKISLTATFYESVYPNFKLSLSGAVDLTEVKMAEVAGSDGKKFILQYTVPNGYKDGSVNVTLSNVNTLNGSNYSSYVEEDVFTKNNRVAPIISLDVSKGEGKIGDEIKITANFSERIKPGVKLSLNGGVTLDQVPMTEVEGSNGQVYSYNYIISEGSSGSVHASIKEVYDTSNNLSKEYVQNDLFIADGIRPSVTDLAATPSSGKLGDKILITATFSEQVKPGVKLSFSNGANLQSELMTEVEGSNGINYYYEYIVQETDMGPVQAFIHDIEDFAGNQNSYNQNLIETDGIKPEVVSIKTDSKTYETGDYVHILVSFSEKVKLQVKIRLTGGINNEEYLMSEIPNSDGKEFELYYEIKEKQYRYVHADLLNIEDAFGNTNTYSESKLFYIHDPSNANLSNISLMSGTEEFPIAPNFSPDVYQYDIELPSSITIINVNAISEDPQTTVNGNGDKNLILGDNLITLTSTSKDGTVKTYKITITVKDYEKPTINGATDRIIKVGEGFNELTGITATDNVDGDITSKIEITGTVDNTKPNDYTLTYMVTDTSGNSISATRKITVIDDLKPVITGATDESIYIGSSFDSKAGVTAKDNVDGDLTGNIKVTGTVNTKVKGIYTLTYTVTDTSENVTTVTRKITVIDNVKPVISGAANKTININTAFNPKTGVTAKDNVDSDLTSFIKVTGSVNTKTKGIYTLTYTVNDTSGNVATVTRKITVIDNIKPIISGATNKTININSTFNPRTSVIARDNVDGDLTRYIKVTGTVNTKKKGIYTLIYTVTDKSGNTTTVTRKITVIDNVKPVISGAKSKTIKLKSRFNPRTGVAAKDNVDGDLTKLIKITGTVKTKKKGVYTLKYTVSDKSGNKAIVIRKITVK